MNKFLSIVLFVLATAGCQNVVPPAPYVAADRQTKTAIEPITQQAAADHPDLKPAVDDVMASWELRLQQAEKGGK